MQASKWTRLFLLLGFLQVMVTIPILIATVIITTDGRERVYSSSSDMRDEIRYLSNKAVRVRTENIWFILYEVWRVWLVIDGVCVQITNQSSLESYAYVFAFAYP